MRVGAALCATVMVILFYLFNFFHMKNIMLSLLMMLVAHTGFSQAVGIEIVNRSGCDIYMKIIGTKDCVCSNEYASDILMVPSGSSITYSTTTTLGGSFPLRPAFLHSAYIYNGPLHCRNIAWLVGEHSVMRPGSLCSFPDEVTFWGLDKECTRMCERLTAKWVNANPTCRGIARLLIY